MFMYGINNRSNITVSNEEIVPNEFYGGGRNAIMEYIILQYNFIMQIK